MRRLPITCAGILMTLSACQTIEQRMAKRTGCDATGVSVVNVINAPGYQEHTVRCSKEKREYKCFDAPFVSSCKDIEEIKKEDKEDKEDKENKENKEVKEDKKKKK